jgi:hypothetical protein
MAEEEQIFSINEFANELEKLLKEVKSESVKIGLLDRTIRGNRSRFDFTGTSVFFRKYFPRFEELYNRVREQGLIKGYIK